MNILAVRSLSAGYGGRDIISGIDFAVEEGSVWAVIGPNGAGKTTLFKTFIRRIQPTQGSVSFFGGDILSLSRQDIARKIAAVLPIADTTISFSAEEVVMMGRFPHWKRFQKPSPADFRIVEESLAFTDALDFCKRKLCELSAGEKHRVILAQALAQQPKLLLLDEPTAHLDIGHQVAFLDLIKKLNRENGLTVIAILHDLNLAGEYCHRMIMLSEGKTFAMGTPEEVLTYQNIEAVYKTVVVAKKNPVSGKPLIILASNENLQQHLIWSKKREYDKIEP